MSSARITRNLELAEKYYLGYHHGPERGYIAGWSAEEDLAEDFVVFHPRFGETRLRDFLGEVTDDAYSRMLNAEMSMYWKTVPDFAADHFQAWPAEQGCAWRAQFGGHIGGEYKGFWESCFILTNDEGKITRWEFYEDFHQFFDIVGPSTGLSDLSELTLEKYALNLLESGTD